MRTTDGNAATMHIGEQYPALTSQYGAREFHRWRDGVHAAALVSVRRSRLDAEGDARRSLAEFRYADVDAEYKVLTGDSVNGIPVIGNGALKSTVNLRMGEWAVLGGLLDVEEAHSIAGLAGASRIPYLGALTSTRTKTGSTDQILLLSRRYPLSMPPSGVRLGGRFAWIGRASYHAVVERPGHTRCIFHSPAPMSQRRSSRVGRRGSNHPLRPSVANGHCRDRHAGEACSQTPRS